MKLAILVASTTLLVSLAPVASLARPYKPHPTNAGIAHRHNAPAVHHHGRSTTKAERMHRRENTHNFGNPNSRNPSQAGYQQQLGSTTNGPRY